MIIHLVFRFINANGHTETGYNWFEIFEGLIIGHCNNFDVIILAFVWEMTSSDHEKCNAPYVTKLSKGRYWLWSRYMRASRGTRTRSTVNFELCLHKIWRCIERYYVMLRDVIIEKKTSLLFKFNLKNWGYIILRLQEIKLYKFIR